MDKQIIDKIPDLPSSRETFETEKKNLDVFQDKPFLRAFIRSVQKINADIIPIYFPETYQLIFVYHGIIIYKIILNRYNIEDISVDLHLKNIKNIIIMLRNNLLPASIIAPIQNKVKKDLNKNKTGKVLT
jgi:hypothetical protein